MASSGWKNFQAQLACSRERVAVMSLLIMIASLLALLLGGVAVVLLVIHRIDVPTF
jgi:hypothetical protein